MSTLGAAVTKHLQKQKESDETLSRWQEIWSLATSGGIGAVSAYLEALLQTEEEEEVEDDDEEVVVDAEVGA